MTGIDFSPASVAYAHEELAEAQGVGRAARFIQADVHAELPRQARAKYDAALFLYGQLAVFARAEAAALLAGAALKRSPAAGWRWSCWTSTTLDKTHSTWWFSDEQGLSGAAPFLNLGERCSTNSAPSIDRFWVIHLPSGKLEEIGLSDNGYETGQLLALLRENGFSQATAYPAWEENSEPRRRRMGCYRGPTLTRFVTLRLGEGSRLAGPPV